MSPQKHFNHWEEYPNIWKTKSAFFTWLRGSLRRSLWDKYPVKFNFKKNQLIKPPEAYKGKGRSGAYCALTDEFEINSKLEVDHIKGNVSLNDYDDIMPFIMHLLCFEKDLQLVTKEAHKIKSYAERNNISFEEAKIEKEAINFSKLPIEEQKTYMEYYEATEKEKSNSKSRREWYKKKLERGESF